MSIVCCAQNQPIPHLYLADHLTRASDVSSRLRLRSANRHQLIVPRCRLNTYGRWAFSIAGPTVWNSLPCKLRDPACGFDSFKQFLKTILLVSTNVTSTLEVFLKWCALYKFTFYLLTYICRTYLIGGWQSAHSQLNSLPGHLFPHFYSLECRLGLGLGQRLEFIIIIIIYWVLAAKRLD